MANHNATICCVPILNFKNSTKVMSSRLHVETQWDYNFGPTFKILLTLSISAQE